MSSLTLALAIVMLELILIGVLALLFGERLRARLFSRRNNGKAFAVVVPEDKSPEIARSLVALHLRLSQPIEPLNVEDPRPAARELAQQALTRAAEVLSKEGRCDNDFAQELLSGCERLAAALERLPVVRETITVEVPSAGEVPEPRRESILKSIMMENEMPEPAAEEEPAAPYVAATDPLDFAMPEDPEI